MNEDKKVLLMVTPYFPPHGGGLEKYAVEIATRLHDAHAWRIVVITSGPKGKRCEKSIENGLTIYRLGYQLKFSNTPFSFTWYRDIKKIINHEQPELVNIHMPVPGIGDVAAYVAGKRPIVITYHAGSMWKIGKILPNIIVGLYEKIALPILLNKASHIICSSEYVSKEFLAKRTTTTITPAVDSTLFKPGSGAKSSRPSVLFVAGLGKADQNKGLRILIQSILLLKKSIPTIQLVVVGGGSMQGEYEHEVQNLGLSKNITFRGKLQGDALVSAYQGSDIFVLPSLAPSESFGMVLLEAMAVGKPVIGTIAGGIPTVVKHKQNGLLVESGDPIALAKAIKRIIDNPELAKRLGDQGRAWAEQKYNWDVQATRFNEILQHFSLRKPHIVQVVGYYPPHIGGMEIVAQEISLELARRQYPVTVLTSNIGSSRGIQDPELTGYKVRRLHSIEIAHTPIMWSLPFRLAFMRKKSIVHTHISQAIIPEIALFFAKLRGFRFVAHFHLDVIPSGIFGFLLSFYKKYVLGIVLRSSDVVIVLSEEQCQFVQSKYRVQQEKISIVPNGVASSFFNSEPRTTFSEPTRLLYVGRLTVQKRVDRLVEAMALLNAPATLTIVGDGEDRKSLEALVNKHNLTNVTFAGKKYGTELQEAYQSADMLVMPSDIEGLPLVAIEAMAAALPIVGSDIPGVRDLIEGVGVLVKDPSAENFATAINALLGKNDELARMSHKSLERAKSFSWELLTKRLEDIYKALMV